MFNPSNFLWSLQSYQSGLRYYLHDYPYEDVLFSPIFVADDSLNNFYSETKGGGNMNELKIEDVVYLNSEDRIEMTVVC